MVAGRSNKQENYLTRLVFGCREASESLPLPARILEDYTESLRRFGHISSPEVYHTVLSQGCVFEIALGVGMVGRTSAPRTGVRMRSLRLPRSGSRSDPFNDLLPQSSKRTDK